MSNNEQRDDLNYRIKSQSDEIKKIQARTFTKALNSAALTEQPIGNFFEDLRDGKRLLKIVNFYTLSERVSYWKIILYYKYSTTAAKIRLNLNLSTCKSV
jgi:hypothetical protein